MAANFFITHKHFDVLQVQGDDAARFLQGQLTCDVNSIADPGCTFGATLNTKGRIITTFLLAHHENRFYLIFNQGLGEIFCTQLGKFLPFYKCQIQPVDNFSFSLLIQADNLEFKALTQNREPAVENRGLPPAATHIQLADGPNTLHLFTGSPQFPGLDEASLPAWQLALMRAGHFPFVPQDSGLYTVQELRLDHHGYVSFEKGCYTGQEIVARMHYRSTPKKQLFRLEFETPDRKIDSEASLIPPPSLARSGQELPPLMKMLPAGRQCWSALAFLSLDPPPDRNELDIEAATITSLEPF